ncbi:MAG: hypothetical protein H0U60_02445 [Blastocatellia bacterium]|nr:hypothetical protein [Blastocatellia bacterium]
MSKTKPSSTNGNGAAVRIEMKLPTKDTPGYLRRQREALALSQQMQDPTARGTETIDVIVNFILPFVVVPTDRDSAREALFDMTETQFVQALDKITGKESASPLAQKSAS